MQGIVAGVVLFGFVFEFRALVPLAALGLIVTFVREKPERTYGITWATEAGLLVLSTLLFLIGRAGWAWVFATVAAGIAALAAAADVWILPDLPEAAGP